MEVQKFFNKKIELEYFFIVGKVTIDSKYFIDKINVGIEEKDNMSHITNVKGSMTRWDFFNNDENFLNVLSKFINYVDDNLDLMKYRLKDSWGLKLQKFENIPMPADTPAEIVQAEGSPTIAAAQSGTGTGNTTANGLPFLNTNNNTSSVNNAAAVVNNNAVNNNSVTASAASAKNNDYSRLSLYADASP